MSGPNAPLSRAFIFCGWQVAPVDILIDESHDLSDPRRQQSLAEQLKKAHFIAAALDCSTKSRAREIPRVFSDGRRAPPPLRSTEHPEGLPDLSPSQRQRVEKDNAACGWVLDQQQQAAQEGRGALRENPLRSLHWVLPKEVAMWESGLWTDTTYAACAWMSARCKQQRLRHNIEELNCWEDVACHHLHHEDEWRPVEHGADHVYPSHEEAEYSAALSFVIAVPVSWWAGRTGIARLRIPRMPKPESAGRRAHWLDYDPRCLRSWAITPMAISLGLQPQDAAEAARIPLRGRVTDLLVDGILPRNCVYVGRGHHSHRLRTTQWASPFVPGHNCSSDEWLPAYIDYIYKHHSAQLPELASKILVCDCEGDTFCESDLLAGLVFDATGSDPQCLPQAAGRPAPPRYSGKKRALQLALMASSAQGLPLEPTLWFKQEAVITCFTKLYPRDTFIGMQFPMIEDLLNQPVFTDYLDWRIECGKPWDGPLGPAMSEASSRLRQRHADGQQAGALSHKAALPPLLSFGLSPDEHFSQALHWTQYATPLEQPPVLDDDLWFAAHWCRDSQTDLPAMRKSAIGVLRELKRRWAPVTKRLRARQTEAIRRVTMARDIGLIGLLIVVMAWADITYPFGLIQGLPAVGYAPNYGIFPHQEADFISLHSVLSGWAGHNQHILGALKPGKDDTFALQQSVKDFEKGFCTPPLTSQQLQAKLKGAPFRLIPRCVITQASGKQRIIDDAARGGQSETSRDCNKLVLCSPLRPAQHVSAVASLMSQSDWGVLMEKAQWWGAGEDWPDAYRHSPISWRKHVLA